MRLNPSEAISSQPPRRSVLWLWVFWLAFLAGAAALVLFSAGPLRSMAREALPEQDPRLVLIPAHQVVKQRLSSDSEVMPTRASAAASEADDDSALSAEPELIGD